MTKRERERERFYREREREFNRGHTLVTLEQLLQRCEVFSNMHMPRPRRDDHRMRLIIHSHS